MNWDKLSQHRTANDLVHAHKYMLSFLTGCFSVSGTLYKMTTLMLECMPQTSLPHSLRNSTRYQCGTYFILMLVFWVFLFFCKWWILLPHNIIFFPFVVPVYIIAMQYLFTSKYWHSSQISNPSSSLVESLQHCVHFLLQEWISYFSGHFWWSKEVLREAFLKLYQPGSVLQLSMKPQKGYIFSWFWTDSFFSSTTCIFLIVFISQITNVGWFVCVMKKRIYKAGWLCSLPQRNSPDLKELKSCYLPQWYT